MSIINKHCRPNGRDLGIVVDPGNGEPISELTICPNPDPDRRLRIDRVVIDNSTWSPWVEVIRGKPGEDPPEEPEDSRTVALVRVTAFTTLLQPEDVG